MDIGRRHFLAALAAGLALDPERLLWRPGAKLISISKRMLPGLVITIPRVVWPGENYGKAESVFRKIERMSRGRDILTWQGMRIFNEWTNDGRLSDNLTAVLLPEGERYAGQFVNTSGFEKLTLSYA
jgi:hypothetical protein